MNFADGYDAADDIAVSGVTGVLAFNDLVAMGLISALTEAGIAVPGAVSVVGFDDIPFARYVTPPLTTAAVPVSELGEQAWVRMWDLLSDRPRGRPSCCSSARRPAWQHRRRAPAHASADGHDRRPLTCGRGAGQGPPGSGPAGEGRGRHLPPVVAMPLTRNLWPNRNTRNSGIKVTTDMANIAPQLLPSVESRNDRSATGTV